MNTAKLRGKMRELSVSQAEAASFIGMSISTFSRKLNKDDGDTFTVKEISGIKDMLRLTDDEAIAIFLP